LFDVTRRSMESHSANRDPADPGPATRRHTVARPLAFALALLTAAAIGGAGDVSAQAPAQNEPQAGEAPEEILPEGRPPSFADLANELLPAVVNISTTQTFGGQEFEGPEMPQFPPGSPFQEFFEEFFERRQGPNLPQRRATSLGSGFVIDSGGYIVTNFHVIEGADEITVLLHDDTNLTAELVGHDDRTDIAVLRVEPDTPLPAVGWGSSEAMRVGDWVIAIGNPFGLGGSVTAGIISARARDINSGPYDDFIQTDASINRGNSGGPMFNLDGEVIGINTAIYSPSGGSVGIGFAIPSSLARNVVDQLIEFGRTRRGWLGVRIQSVTEDIAEGLGLDEARGALVASVTPGGPAAEAGIEPGDVIIEFSDREIDEMRSLPRIVAETSVGSEVEVTVWRQGELETLTVTLGELEAAEDAGLLAGLPDEPGGDDGKGAEEQLESLGMALADVTDELRRRFDLPSEAGGVVVTDVAPGSPAAERGLQPGEVIVEVGQDEVSSVEEVVGKIREARDAGRRSVLLLVEREGDMRFIALNIEDFER
jgi:serine protease Do